MRTACLLILVSVTLFATPETVLQADRVAHLLVLNSVYLNGQGPFRMMIDTGNTSSGVRPAVANRLGLRPVYAVEVESAAGATTVATAILDEVRVGALLEGGVEVMIMDLKLPGVDGVLGQSWLARHDYMLDYRHRRLVVDAATPDLGIRAALRSGDGRPQISADVNGRRQDLVVDSGASVLVVFGQAPPVASTILATNNGSIEAGTGGSRVTIGGRYSRWFTTAEVNAGPQPGLLPATAFKSVYISNRHGVVVFVP